MWKSIACAAKVGVVGGVALQQVSPVPPGCVSLPRAAREKSPILVYGVSWDPQFPVRMQRRQLKPIDFVHAFFASTR